MCYDAKALLETQLKRAKKYNDAEWQKEIEEDLIPFEKYNLYHAAGFSHPQLLIYPDNQPYKPTPSTWGLLPHWVKDDKQRMTFWNRTLNARGETIFEKPAFRDAAKNSRCLIYMDGFYEHHHFKGKTYPFFIQRADKSPMIMAGLWSKWKNPANLEEWHTFAIVTTKGNSLMEEIHNNPKLAEPRMPLILPEVIADQWLQPVDNELDQQAIQDLILPLPENELVAHTVRKLRGKEATGNLPKASELYDYYELINKDQTLF